MSKDEALKKIEELKAYVKDEERKKTSSKLKILNKDGDVLWESEKKTIKEAVEEAVNRGANLCGANLRGVYLWGANLRGANLRGVDFSGTDLRGANLGGTDFWGANLKGANLGETDFRGADLRGVELMNAKFTGRGGTTRIKKSQLDDFLTALGIIVED